MSIVLREQLGESGSFGLKNEADGTRVFRGESIGLVRVDAVLAALAAQYGLVPHRLDTETGRFVDRVRIDQDEDNPYLFTAEVDEKLELEEKEEPDNPLAKPAEIDYKARQVKRLTLVDGKGDPLLNTARDFLEGIERTDSDGAYTVRKAVAKVSSWLFDYEGTVNSDEITLRTRTWRKRFPIHTLLFQNLSIPAEQTTKRGVAYTDVSFELHFRRRGWAEFFPNRGFNELVERKVKDENGNTVTEKRLEKILVGEPPEAPSEPVWIDENGKAFRKKVKREDGSTKEAVRQPERGEMIVLRFLLQPEMPFARLPIR